MDFFLFFVNPPLADRKLFNLKLLEVDTRPNTISTYGMKHYHYYWLSLNF